MRSDIRITDVNINKHRETGETRYSALIDKWKLVQYRTDGVKKKHIGLGLWIKYVEDVMNRM